MLLAGDIGGTKTLLALYAPERGAREPLVMTEFHSADYPGLDDIAREFLALHQSTVEYACFDVAGPVIGGHAKLTNLPWDLAESALCASLALKRATLLNDLKAVAYAVPHLTAEDLVTINPGTPEPGGPIAVVAPGTGLGEAYLVWDGSAYLACSSEGGHASFAPTDDRQAGLLRFLATRFGTVSYERVCSGPGIANIYDYLKGIAPGSETPELAALLRDAADRTPVISQAGLDDAAGESLPAAALDLFIDIMADEAGNMALKVLSTGGVFLAGGIPARILPRLTTERFMRAFTNKGRMAPLLSSMPVHVVTASAALIGAAQYGLDHMQPA